MKREIALLKAAVFLAEARHLLAHWNEEPLVLAALVAAREAGNQLSMAIGGVEDAERGE